MKNHPIFPIGGKQMSGRFHMFKLSDGRIWLLTMENPWTNKVGSYIIQDGMTWTGFTHPSGSKPWTKFSIVQLDKDEDKNKFVISGGFVDSATSLSCYLFDAEVSLC